MFVELLTFVCFFAIFHYVYSQRRYKSFPPGPFSWPIIGNCIQVGLEPHKTIMEMKENYGNIIGLNLGPKKAVFINEYGIAKEAFNLSTLCGRPDFLHLQEPKSGILRGRVISKFKNVQMGGIHLGIIGTSGKVSIEQRRFAFSYIQSGLRNGTPIENLILNEANELIKHLKEKCGRSISTNTVFNIPVINSLWSIITGERYSMTDEKFLKVTEYLYRIFTAAAAQGIFIYFPKWSKIFPRLSGYTYVMSNVISIHDFVQEVINRHKETYEEGIQRDFVDCYLHKIKTTTDINSSFFGNVGEENLKHCLYDILSAGTETVSTTLRWLVYLMAFYPEKQEKLNSIIVRQIKPGELPALKDQQKLPFVEAVIAEVLRFSSMVPIGVFHKAMEDIKFHGYIIPKGTLVAANLYGIAHDPDVWKDPEVFRPERFLNEDETEMLDHRAMMPFSIGRRVCPGESLARDELFLFTVRLFQSFKVEFDPNEPFPQLGYVNGLTLSPIIHKVVFNLRLV